MKEVKHQHRKLTKEQRWRKRGYPRATNRACMARRNCDGCPWDGRLCLAKGDRAFHPF